MSTSVLLFLTIVFGIGSLWIWRSWRQYRRAEFIRSYDFPPSLFDKVRKKYPMLDAKQYQLVARGLRQYFLAHLQSGNKFVSMPSKIVDELWHEFILHTRQYEHFCKQAFGKFLHHSPAVALGKKSSDSNVGLRRVWWYACRDENIDPRKATRLPLLFALDAKLQLADGYYYSVGDHDFGGKRAGAANACSGSSSVHYTYEFSDDTIDGSIDGFGDSGGDGGGGCGGD